MTSAREALSKASFSSIEEIQFNPMLGVPSIDFHGAFLASK